MASDDKKVKTSLAPKSEPAATKKVEGAPKDKSPVADAPRAEPAKTESGEAAASPKSYSRGEGQKAVSQAYKDNWNAIYGKKNKKKKKR
jgi:hypothetical protein